MEEAKVTELRPEAKKPKQAQRVRFEPVLPTSIVEVWRLVENSLRSGAQLYPDLTEDQPQTIQSHLLVYLQGQRFSGLIARMGKRPVGLVLGDVQIRPFGRPSRFAFIQSFWVEPGFREQAIGKALWSEYSERMKKAGIFHWERLVSGPEMADEPSGNQLIRVVGGRL